MELPLFYACKSGLISKKIHTNFYVIIPSSTLLQKKLIYSYLQRYLKHSNIILKKSKKH